MVDLVWEGFPKIYTRVTYNCEIITSITLTNNQYNDEYQSNKPTHCSYDEP